MIPYQAARDRVLLGVGALALWQVFAWMAGDLVLAAPLATARAAWSMLGDAGTWPDFAETAGAVARAAAISVFGGIVAGATLGTSARLASVSEPLLIGLYSLPKLTFYPVILLLFGLGLSAKVALGALHGIIPVVLFTLSGIRNVPAVHRQTARAMRLGRAATACRVLIPSALPELLSGVRLGLALTLLGTLVGEMFASQAGIGHALRQAMSQADGTAITALATLILVVAIGLDQTFVRIARMLLRGAADLQGGSM